MEMQDIIKITNDFLVEEFEVEEERILPQADLRETCDLDSLDFVDLVVEIENNFGLKMKGEDFVDIISFQDFYDYIETHVNQTVAE